MFGYKEISWLLVILPLVLLFVILGLILVTFKGKMMLY